MSDMILADVEGEEGVREIIRTRGSEGAIILAKLSFHELQILREATKRQFMKFYPVEFFTDREADRIIETLAPATAQKMIKHIVDKKEGKLIL